VIGAAVVAAAVEEEKEGSIKSASARLARELASSLLCCSIFICMAKGLPLILPMLFLLLKPKSPVELLREGLLLAPNSSLAVRRLLPPPTIPTAAAAAAAAAAPPAPSVPPIPPVPAVAVEGRSMGLVVMVISTARRASSLEEPL